MNVEMVPVEIIGMKSDLHLFLTTVRRLGCVHIDNVSDCKEVLVRPLTMDAQSIRREEELRLLAARVESLQDILCKSQSAAGVSPLPANLFDLAEISTGLEALLPTVQSLTRRRKELESEAASLPLYEATLRKLIPLVPPAAYAPGNLVVGVLVNRANIAVLDLVGKQVLEITAGTACMVSSDIDESTRAMLIVLHKDDVNEVESLLGQKDVTRLRLPPELGEGLPDTMLETIHRRLLEIPAQQKQIDLELSTLADRWSQCLNSWNIFLKEELEAYQVLYRFGETDMTFTMVGWVPRKELPNLETKLNEAIGAPILLYEQPFPAEMRARAPVILQNPLPVRPFERLVNMLEIPRYGHIDPTALISLFLPVFFGLMLGDIGYGLIILAVSLGLTRKFRSGFAHDLLVVIAMGSGWAIVFGILFGELFGTLGENLGLYPIWMARDSAEDVLGFLLLSVAIGAGHVTLGLILGVFEAFRDHSRTHLLERGGMLLGLVSLFLLVGVLVDFLPAGFMTPAVAGVIIGIVLLSASLGWLGILMGPIEFIGLIGNVLSYLRIAAIGLASVYLAKVANGVAGMAGSIVVGLILAVLIHALNLVLGVFSPTIHSLRLQYVEFFRKFYEGGGRPYEPFRSHLV
jgi:V/A-type H+/Na+-transporting ATPase subunit I